MGVGEFVAGVDRLLTRAHGLFGAGAGSGGGEVFAAGGGGGSVPPPPAGGSGLGSGVAAAGGVYEQSQAGVSGLDVDSGQTAGAGGAVADQGRAGAGVIRDQARTVAAATAPLGNSAAGARLVVAAMDEHLAAMQRQLDTTTEQNKVLAARLRQLAEAYRGAGGAGMGAGMPMAGMGRSADGRRRGGGGLSGLSGLAALPASLMSGGAGSGGGREPGSGFLDSMLGHDGRGSEPAQRAVAFAESKLGAPYVWGSQGPGAFDCSGLVKDSYAHAGISLPRSTYDMIRVGTTVDRSEIRAGDLVFSNFSGRGPEHVQLAVSPVQVIEAPTPGGHVQYSSVPHGRVVVKRVV